MKAVPLLVCVLTAALLAVVTPAAAQTAPPADAAVRFFFMSDGHSRQPLLRRFIEDALREQPGLIVDGGDFVHDATESEFRMAFALREQAGQPWYAVRGNHDMEPRGPFTAPVPEIPAFATVLHQGVRFILIDNHDGLLSEALYERLEAELRQHQGQRMIVAMHVPALLSREPGAARLRRFLPFPLAEPRMHEPGQVARFTTLMERFGVLAVLAGHTHTPDEVERNGVRYIVAGAVGGLTPGLGIANEYLDITVDGRALNVRRIPLNRPAGDPFTFLLRAFRFYAELNGFNHAEQGWNYVPSASVQVRSSLVRVETRGEDRPLLSAGLSFERVLGARGRQAFFADAAALAGTADALVQLGAGYRVRPIGTFNRNVFIDIGVNGTAGLLAERGTADVGVRGGLGVEWRTFTLQVARDRSTGFRSASVAAGRRF